LKLTFTQTAEPGHCASLVHAQTLAFGVEVRHVLSGAHWALREQVQK